MPGPGRGLLLLLLLLLACLVLGRALELADYGDVLDEEGGAEEPIDYKDPCKAGEARPAALPPPERTSAARRLCRAVPGAAPPAGAGGRSRPRPSRCLPGRQKKRAKFSPLPPRPPAARRPSRKVQPEPPERGAPLGRRDWRGVPPPRLRATLFHRPPPLARVPRGGGRGALCAVAAAGGGLAGGRRKAAGAARGRPAGKAPGCARGEAAGAAAAKVKGGLARLLRPRRGLFRFPSGLQGRKWLSGAASSSDPSRRELGCGGASGGVCVCVGGGHS